MSKIDGARQFVMRLASCWEMLLDNGSDEERRIHGGRAINATIKSIRIASGRESQILGWCFFSKIGCRNHAYRGVICEDCQSFGGCNVVRDVVSLMC